jgi:hypothetical protein
MRAFVVGNYLTDVLVVNAAEAALLLGQPPLEEHSREAWCERLPAMASALGWAGRLLVATLDELGTSSPSLSRTRDGKRAVVGRPKSEEMVRSVRISRSSRCVEGVMPPSRASPR